MAQVTFNIEVLAVQGPTFTKTPKGGYNQIEVAFKKDGKVEGKKLIDFKYPEVYKFFTALKGGEKVQVTSEKNDGDKYWNWVSAAQGALGTTEPSTAGTPSDTSGSNSDAGGKPESKSASAPRTRVAGSNYETPAERARRQVYIVRQSSISAAIEQLKANQGIEPQPFDTEQVINVARLFEAYVFEPKVVGKFDDLNDDIPF